MQPTVYIPLSLLKLLSTTERPGSGPDVVELLLREVLAARRVSKDAGGNKE